MSKSIMDQFIEGLGNAVQDIREKAVEQAYFGQTVTDNIQPTPDLAPAEPANKATGDLWTEYVKAGREPKERDEISREEPGLDR